MGIYHTQRSSHTDPWIEQLSYSTHITISSTHVNQINTDGLVPSFWRIRTDGIYTFWLCSSTGTLTLVGLACGILANTISIPRLCPFYKVTISNLGSFQMLTSYLPTSSVWMFLMVTHTLPHTPCGLPQGLVWDTSATDTQPSVASPMWSLSSGWHPSCAPCHLVQHEVYYHSYTCRLRIRTALTQKIVLEIEFNNNMQ